MWRLEYEGAEVKYRRLRLLFWTSAIVLLKETWAWSLPFVKSSKTIPSIEVRLAPPENPLPQVTAAIHLLERERMRTEESLMSKLEDVFNKMLIESRDKIEKSVERAMRVFEDKNALNRAVRGALLPITNPSKADKIMSAQFPSFRQMTAGAAELYPIDPGGPTDPGGNPLSSEDTSEREQSADKNLSEGKFTSGRELSEGPVEVDSKGRLMQIPHTAEDANRSSDEHAQQPLQSLQPLRSINSQTPYNDKAIFATSDEQLEAVPNNEAFVAEMAIPTDKSSGGFTEDSTGDSAGDSTEDSAGDSAGDSVGDAAENPVSDSQEIFFDTQPDVQDVTTTSLPTEKERLFGERGAELSEKDSEDSAGQITLLNGSDKTIVGDGKEQLSETTKQSDGPLSFTELSGLVKSLPLSLSYVDGLSFLEVASKGIGDAAKNVLKKMQNAAAPTLQVEVVDVFEPDPSIEKKIKSIEQTRNDAEAKMYKLAASELKEIVKITTNELEKNIQLQLNEYLVDTAAVGASVSAAMRSFPLPGGNILKKKSGKFRQIDAAVRRQLLAEKKALVIVPPTNRNTSFQQTTLTKDDTITPEQLNVKVSASDKPYPTVDELVDAMQKKRDATERLERAKILELELRLMMAQQEMIKEALRFSVAKAIALIGKTVSIIFSVLNAPSLRCALQTEAIKRETLIVV